MNRAQLVLEVVQSRVLALRFAPTAKEGELLPKTKVSLALAELAPGAWGKGL